MYVYQNGKLYTQKDDILIGVEIHSDKIILVEGTECKIDNEFQLLTPYEVQCKFHEGYKFPIEIKVENEKEVIVNDPTPKAKRTPRKSTSK